MKAISPLIGVVLLIAFTVGLGTLITIFTTGLTTTSTGITKSSSENLTQCSFGVLEIKKVECSTSKNGLIGYWKLETVNTTNYTSDLSGNNFNGRLFNFSCDPATCNVTTGRYNQGLDFDGSNDFVNISHNVLLNWENDTSKTIMAWIKPNGTTPSYQVIMIKGNATGPNNPDNVNYQLRLEGAQLGFVYRSYDNSSWHGMRSGSIIRNQSWSHVAVTHTMGGGSSALKMYVNGTEVTTSVSSGNMSSAPNINNGGFKISADGSAVGGSVYSSFNGTIDEVRIYNRTLSAGEIADIYANGPSLRVLISNSGPTNLGANFTVSHTVGGVPNASYANLTSGLSPAATGLLRIHNISNSGSVGNVRVGSISCPVVVSSKEVFGEIC